MQIFFVGGVVMYPLLLLSVLSLTLTIERALFWRRMLSGREAERWRQLIELVRKRDWEAAGGAANRDPTVFGLFARRFVKRARAGVTEADGRELIESVRPSIERFGTALSTIITAAPCWAFWARCWDHQELRASRRQRGRRRRRRSNRGGNGDCPGALHHGLWTDHRAIDAVSVRDFPCLRRPGVYTPGDLHRCGRGSAARQRRLTQSEPSNQARRVLRPLPVLSLVRAHGDRHG